MPSTVYYQKNFEIEKIIAIIPDMARPMAIKTHFGEAGNNTYVKADKIKQIAEKFNFPNLIETTVLYKSPRSTAATHRQLAHDHGFDFAPIDILDGEEGDDNLEVKISGNHFDTCYLGGGLSKYESVLVVSHFKGHGGAGFGAALKNLGMGLASRRGKLAQHASIKHNIKEADCISCGACIRNCPVEAIAFNQNNKAEINQMICISCSKCISVCPTGAVRIPWGSTGSQGLGEKISEYALAAVQDRQMFYINFLTDITKDCDCQGKKMDVLADNLGVLASLDPVAIDQAGLDLVLKQVPGLDKGFGNTQLKYAETLGLGSVNYNLINL